MNFKLIVVLFLAIGCGVKGDPTSPQNPPLHSLIENYPDIKLEKPVNTETSKKQ